MERDFRTRTDDRIESTGKTYSLGFSMGASIGVNRSSTRQDSYTTVSVMDLNGDGYPDWIRDENGSVRAQLTGQTGIPGDGLQYDVESPASSGKSET